MIDVKIIENNGLVALCTITGPEGEFRRDLARIKAIPYRDRTFVNNVEPNYWRVRNAEYHARQVLEIQEAIQTYRMQLRFL